MTDIFKFSFVADTKIGGEWANQSLSLFAVIPGTPDFEETRALVEDLVKTYRDAAANKGGSAEKNEVLSTLYELHARQLILWPLGTHYDQSVLGHVDGRRFFRLVAQDDPNVMGVREYIETCAAFQKARYAGTLARTRSNEYWLLFITMRLATIGLTGIARITEDHVFALFTSLKIYGAWADWLSKLQRRAVARFTRFLSVYHDNPLFASSFLNPARSFRAGKRVPDPLAANPHLLWLYTSFEIWLDESVIMTKSVPRMGRRSA